jgi:hypothetical protein
MEAVERRASDEQTNADRTRFSCRALPFGTQVVKCAP